MKNISLIFILLFILSCDRNDNNLEKIPENKQFISGYSPYYMVDLLKNMEENSYKVILENDGNHYTKKKYSGFLNVGNGVISLDTREDIISTEDNEIKVEQKDRVITNYHFVVKMKNNKMIEKITTNYKNKDTLIYTYENQQLRTITNRNNGIFYKAKVYYNTQNNIDSILITYNNGVEYSHQGNPYYIFDENRKPSQKIVLSDYDSYDNPLKNLGYFDDLFIRSLSRNNFRKYRRYSYDNNGNIISESGKEWTLHYENGKVKFD